MALAWSDSFAFSLDDARGFVNEIARVLVANASGLGGGPFPVWAAFAGVFVVRGRGSLLARGWGAVLVFGRRSSRS